MDFTNRGVPQQPTHQPQQFGGNPQPVKNKLKVPKNSKLYRGIVVLLGTLIVLLIIAVVLVIGFGGPKSESSYVYGNKLQAVFLNTGQVYFGNIKSINPQYLVLTNIFYLQTNNNGSSSSSSTSNTNVSLVKLGCELHAPYDQMVINMSQVTFWENLHNYGQVGKAVARYEQQYPNGQTCKNQSNNTTSGATTNSVQNAPSSSAPATTKKP